VLCAEYDKWIKKKVLSFPAGGVELNHAKRNTLSAFQLIENPEKQIEYPEPWSEIVYSSYLYNLKSILILTLAVEYAIFSMERTKYLKKDMS